MTENIRVSRLLFVCQCLYQCVYYVMCAIYCNKVTPLVITMAYVYDLQSFSKACDKECLFYRSVYDNSSYHVVKCFMIGYLLL